MRRRPWALVILAILHFLAPVGNVIFNAINQKRNVMQYLVYALSPEYMATNWVILLAPIVAGIAIYACQKWSFYVYLFAMGGLMYESFTAYQAKAGVIGILPILLVYLINFAVVAYFLLPAVRNVYFDRRMRWWEIQARYKTNFRCNWRDLHTTEMQTGIVGNFSENGLFLKSDIHPQDKEKVHIEIPFNNNLNCVFAGEAIVHDRVDAIGFGVKFDHTSESRRHAKALVADLESKGQRMTTNDVRPEDRFSFWVRNLVTTGKGFVPKKDSENQ